MKAIQCEMCSSTNFVKDDGYFVCQHCGTKYTVEEARKMMVEGIVRIDDTEDLKKLYQAARNAREASDYESALSHYETINAKDPNSWEAIFYLTVLKTNSIKNGEIGTAAIKIQNCLPKVFDLIKSEISDEEEKKDAVREVLTECFDRACGLSSASLNFKKTLTKGNGLMALTGVVGALSSLSSTGGASMEHQDRCGSIANILCMCGLCIEQKFDINDPDYRKFVGWAYENMISFNTSFLETEYSNIFNDQALIEYAEKTRSYNESYVIPAYIVKIKEKLQKKEDREKQKAEIEKRAAERNESGDTCNYNAVVVAALVLAMITPFLGAILGAVALIKGKEYLTPYYRVRAVVAIIMGIVMQILLIILCATM